MSIINLWEETIEFLEENNYTWEDVIRIGNNEGYIKKSDFKKFAKNYNYDNGYGIEYVPLDLIIEGKGFKMFRGEYDGSEWWRIMYTNSVNTTKNIKFEDLKTIFREVRN